MKYQNKLKKGFTILEVLVAVGIFGVVSSAVSGLLVSGSVMLWESGKYGPAVGFLEEGVEGLRAVKMRDWTAFGCSNCVLNLVSGQWELVSGTSSIQDIYTRTIDLDAVYRDTNGNVVAQGAPGATLDDRSRMAKVRVSWISRTGQPREVDQKLLLSNWDYYIDGIAPDAISDLTTQNSTTNSIGLTWTSPGDDNNSGIATSYDLRYSTSSINEGNWATATQVTGEPVPEVAGTVQSMTVSGLSDVTTYYFAIKTSDEIPNISGLSNVASASTSPLPDTTSPATITNLATQNPTVNAIDLTWTAPGDDDDMGTATSYDLRYSTSSINEGNWASATQVTGEPVPAVAGTTQNMTVAGLNGATTYYFAIKTSDEIPNESALSNVATGSTSLWNSPVLQASLDFASSNTDGLKVATVGNFAYVVMSSTSNNFRVVEITNPATPVLRATLTLPATSTPSNIFVSGNFAYISSSSDTQELQVVNISNPASPSAVGSYNALGSANATSIFVANNIAYLTRQYNSTVPTDPELVLINVTTPTSPALLGSLNLNGNSNDIYVSGNYAYIASSDNTQDLQVVDVGVPSTPTLASTLDLANTNDAITIIGSGTKVYVGKNDGFVFDVTISNPLAPTSTVNRDTGTSVLDMDIVGSLLFLATSTTTDDFQVLNLANNLARLGGINLASTLNGVVYNASLDRVIVVGTGNTTEVEIIRPQ
jgi:prepilin-type N-terminal cleavage/methylation domain-containing protein